MFLPAAPVETQAPAILALAALLILLGLLSTALLGHLLCFHIYLSECLLQACTEGEGVSTAGRCLFELWSQCRFFVVGLGLPHCLVYLWLGV